MTMIDDIRQEKEKVRSDWREVILCLPRTVREDILEFANEYMRKGECTLEQWQHAEWVSDTIIKAHDYGES